MHKLAGCERYLKKRLPECGHGVFFTAEELAEGSSAEGCPLVAEDVSHLIKQNRGITVAYRGGNSQVPLTLDRPNREATLYEIAPGVFSFETESAVQLGIQHWIQSQGLVCKQEVPDKREVIQRITQERSLSFLPDIPKSGNTRCRDLMAHRPESPVNPFLIIEVKGKTQLEADFYETWGQIFPVADESVTKGWTIKKVPKHGLALQHAREFVQVWSGNSDARLELIVAVPDLPPHEHGCASFYDGPSSFYPKQAEMYAQFLRSGDAHGDNVFARLLRYLRDEFGLLDMASGKCRIGFGFWGYQGLNWIRDFGSNCPVKLLEC